MQITPDIYEPLRLRYRILLIYFIQKHKIKKLTSRGYFMFVFIFTHSHIRACVYV